MSTTQGETPDCLDRPEFALLEVLPYVLLAIATVLAVGIDSGDSTKLIVDLAGSAAAAVWMLWFLTLHRRWRDRRPLMAVFFIGLVVISAVLVINDPVYGFFSWTGFLWLHEVVQGRLRIVGLVAVAAVTGTSQHGGLPGATAGSWASWVAIVGLNVFVYSAIGWMMERRDEEYTMRAKMVEDLTEANAKLEASMRENAGLHEQLLTGAREAGVLDERHRMAREIHDTLAQGLVGIITQLEAATQGGTGSQRHTDAALDLARESLGRGAPFRPGSDAGAARGGSAPGRTRGGRRALVRSHRRRHADDHHGYAAGGASGGRGGTPARGPGGVGQRRQARRGEHGRPVAFLHGRRRPSRARARRSPRAFR